MLPKETIGHIQSAGCLGQKEVVTAAHNACIRELLQEIDVHGKADRHMKLLKLERESSLGIPLWIWPQTRMCPIQFFQIIKKSFLSVSIILKPLVKMETFWKPKKNPGPLVPKLVCVECLIGKQKKPILFNLSRFKLITDRVAFEPICLRRQNLS